MKLIIECQECNKQYESNANQIWIRDITPCSCGCCHGEKYAIIFEKCPHCGHENEVQT